MKEPSEIERFFSKVENEGGYYGALDYGLNGDTYGIPAQMAAQWDRIRAAFDKLQDQIADFEAAWDPEL